jgi:hypothetical protein
MVSISAHPLNEEPSEGAYDAPTIPSRRRSSQRSEWANPSLLARLAGSDSRSWATVFRSPTPRAHQRRRFRPVKASVTFCVLGTYADPRKVQWVSKETEEMHFAVQPNG